MAATDNQNYSRPVAIAPATTSPTNGASPQPTMPYACQACTKRKVRCNKATPLCASCRKGKLECIYQAPPPRRRMKILRDVNEKVARYERILRQHDLLPQDDDTSPGVAGIEETTEELSSLSFAQHETSKTGSVDSNLWRNFGDEMVERISDDEEEEDQVIVASDPFTAAFMGSYQSLLHYHPTHADAMLLWKTHIENVEPICKVLHIPSTSRILEITSQEPIMASKADECLLFAIYHFAVYSMTDEQCLNSFGQSRATLTQIYHYATRQALVNASFLKTTEMSVMQALVLFLLPGRFTYDPHTYWIMTGVAVRIAQRMGLHRDGEKMDLTPFEVQMRRRVFYQVIPLDGMASQTSGTGIAIMPETWDTQQPLNISDDQIWPGMTETPEEQKGATEMIFFLARASIGKFFVKAGATMRGPSGQFKDYNEVEPAICAAESEVEENYIRYCDILDPLHFLTIISARSAITAMRIRVRLPKVRNKTATNAERREIFQLGQKILDTDAAACAHTGLKRFRWHLSSLFVWGSWDSLIFTITTLRNADLLTRVETDSAWSKVEQIYTNHSDLLNMKQALHVAIGRVTLKGWDINPPSSSVPEPAFITTLRSMRRVNQKHRSERQDSYATNPDSTAEITPPSDPSPASDANALFDSLSGSMDLDIGNDFNVDTSDWLFWDRLMQNHQTHPPQQQGGYTK